MPVYTFVTNVTISGKDTSFNTVKRNGYLNKIFLNPLF
jgi:hypothetical protein